MVGSLALNVLLAFGLIAYAANPCPDHHLAEGGEMAVAEPASPTEAQADPLAEVREMAEQMRKEGEAQQARGKEMLRKALLPPTDPPVQPTPAPIQP